MAETEIQQERRRSARDRFRREIKWIMDGTFHTDRPMMAHIIPIRRCNLACTYCNEFDDFSKPVPLSTMRQRIEQLGRLKTGVVTISGGEPLLHPDLDEIIRCIRRNATLSGLITNGLLLTPERIKALNDAGLDYLQISTE